MGHQPVKGLGCQAKELGLNGQMMGAMEGLRKGMFFPVFLMAVTPLGLSFIAPWNSIASPWFVTWGFPKDFISPLPLPAACLLSLSHPSYFYWLFLLEVSSAKLLSIWVWESDGSVF